MKRRVWNSPLWFDKPVGRILFFRDLQGLEGLRLMKNRTYPGGFSFTFRLQPEGIPERNVTVSFSRGNPNVPHVQVDGPSDSPHRYENGDLCMWYPFDPPELQWSPRDGAGSLAAEIGAHLLREEYFRTYGEWIGEEAPHERRHPQNDLVRIGED